MYSLVASALIEAVASIFTLERVRDEPEPVAKAPLAPDPVVLMELSDMVMELPPPATTAALRP